MIVADTNDIQPRNSPCTHQGIEILFPLAEPGGIRYRQVPAGKARTVMFLQRGDQRIRRPILFLAALVPKLAIAPVTDAGTLTVIPDEPILVIGDGPVALGI